MIVYLNKISGIEEAIIAMYVSKRNWSRELEENVYSVCSRVLLPNGLGMRVPPECSEEDYDQFVDWMTRLTKWGWKHTTLLRFIDFSFTVKDIHRAGQDDWDSHAKRFNNRIIRSSTRLAKFGYEMSDYYKGKIIPTDQVLGYMGVNLPERINVGEDVYVRAVNGYVKEGLEKNNDVLRGLYMLSIPSTFTYKIDLTEFAHVYKERNKNGTANEEVKQVCEYSCDLIEKAIPWFNRELLDKIKN